MHWAFINWPKLAFGLLGGAFRCFYKPGTGTNNPWFRNVGLLNTFGKIVTGATVGGRPGFHAGDNPFYAFSLGRAIGTDEQVPNLSGR